MADSDRWFGIHSQPELCRVGGNGPDNTTQIIPIVRYTKDGESFLDVGCGSGATLDTLIAVKRDVFYKGIDVIETQIEYLKKSYPNFNFEVQDGHKPKEKDRSWDTVWSRHVVDHLGDFEGPMDEYCRIANKRVICVLWYSLTDDPNHVIKNIEDGPLDARVTYKDEYLNQYSRERVKKWLENKKNNGWDILEFQEDCVWDMSRNGKGWDVVIILERQPEDEETA